MQNSSILKKNKKGRFLARRAFLGMFSLIFFFSISVSLATTNIRNLSYFDYISVKLYCGINNIFKVNNSNCNNNLYSLDVNNRFAKSNYKSFSVKSLDDTTTLEQNNNLISSSPSSQNKIEQNITYVINQTKIIQENTSNTSSSNKSLSLATSDPGFANPNYNYPIYPASYNINSFLEKEGQELFLNSVYK